MALQHMHSRSIVHMDVKPENIYIVNEVTYKLGDLGLAASSSTQYRGNIEEGDARCAQTYALALAAVLALNQAIPSA